MRVQIESERMVAVRERVERRGWSVVKLPRKADVLELASALGEPVPSRRDGPLVDELRLVPSELAPPRSLSRTYGLGSFPYHTDAAHHPVPPRYAILRLASSQASDRATHVAPLPLRRLRARERALLEHDVWLVNGGRGRFLTSIISHLHRAGPEIVRFDAECMRPAAPMFGESRGVFEGLCHCASRAVHWMPGKALIIDNWRTAHARGEGDGRTGDRVLERVLVAMK
jgi:alpha-ketoglutarate-dependent taurine dioxygenase